jgi:hypothetical protein
MKKTALLLLILLTTVAHAQLFVESSTVVGVDSNTDVYTNEDFINEGTVTFKISNFYVDSNFNNRASSSTINYNDVTLYIGVDDADDESGDANVVYRFKDRDAVTRVGEQIKFVVFNKSAGSVDVEGHLGISETLDIESPGTLTADGSGTDAGVFTLLNRAASNSAQVIESNGTGTARVEVERYMSANRVFRFYSPGVTSTETINQQLQEGAASVTANPFLATASSPAFGTHITGVAPNPLINAAAGGNSVNGLDWQPSGDASMFVYDQGYNGVAWSLNWPEILNTNMPVDVSTAYRIMVRGSRGLNITDNAAVADETVLRTRGELQIGSFSPTIETAADAVSFVANPYAAAIDYSQVTKSSGMNSFIALWDINLNTTGLGGNNQNPLLDDYSGGGFVFIDGSNVPSPTLSTLGQFIQPGQSFLVRAAVTPATTPSITFEEAHKGNSTNPVQAFSTINYFNLRLEATGTQNVILDGVGFRFNDAYSDDADENDAFKINNPNTNLGIIKSTDLLAIENRSVPTEQEIVPLALTGHKHQSYQFVPTMNIDGLELEIYLKDNYLNEVTPLEDLQNVSFSIDESIPASVNPYRFELIFGQVSLSSDDFSNAKFTLYPNPAVSEVNVVLPANVSTTADWDVKLFSINGQLIKNWKFDSSNPSLNLPVGDLNVGVYLLELSNDEYKSTQKFIKE